MRKIFQPAFIRSLNRIIIKIMNSQLGVWLKMHTARRGRRAERRETENEFSPRQDEGVVCSRQSGEN
jgi:hypothetical protein